MVEPVRVTLQTLRILQVLMGNPSGEHYGMDLLRDARVSSGTLYPILRRLEKAGWLTSRWEELPEDGAGRPRRRYYQLTGAGASRADAELATMRAPTGTLRQRRAI